jgi:DNA-binding transcriptional LysR family regulator
MINFRPIVRNNKTWRQAIFLWIINDVMHNLSTGYPQAESLPPLRELTGPWNLRYAGSTRPQELVMRRHIVPYAVFVLLALSPVPLAAGEPGVNAADEPAIRAVIESQLRAFRHDDSARAFSFASPGIRRKFANTENFMAMVRSGYPAVYRPQEVEFRGLRAEGGRLLQEVLFVGPDGRPVVAVYEMQRQPDGSWRINGVTLVRAGDEMT